MKQDVAPTTAEKRSRWHALRPWLLLGGFVAVWWVLSTGTAQADSTPRLHLVERVSGLTQATPVRHLADHGHQVKATAHHAATPVRDRVKTVSHVTHSTVTVAATSVREVTDGQLPSIVKTPMTKLTRKATSTVGDAVPNVVPMPESSTTQGDSAHRGSNNDSAAESFSTVSSRSTTTAFLDTLEVTPIAFASRTAAALGGPFSGPLDAPATCTALGLVHLRRTSLADRSPRSVHALEPIRHPGLPHGAPRAAARRSFARPRFLA